MIFLHPRRLWLLLVPALPVAFLLLSRSPISAFASLLKYEGGYCVAFLVVFTILVVATQAGKPCTTSISAEGLRDESGSRQTVIGWKRVIKIAAVGSDIIFYKSFYLGTFLPLSAFTDPREAQRFYETAVGYWQSAKSGRPFTPADVTEIWPPAPAAGNSAEPGDTL